MSIHLQIWISHEKGSGGTLLYSAKNKGYLNTTNTEIRDHTVLREIENLEQIWKTWVWLKYDSSWMLYDLDLSEESETLFDSDLEVICTVVTVETIYMDEQVIN